MDSLHISAWTLEEFAGGRARWQELLEASQADPFFMSWDWQWHWWNAHAPLLGATLRVLAVQTREDRLVGLAPFYSHSVRHQGIRLRRLELIGSAWRRDDTVFSEYLDLIALAGCADEVLGCTAQWLAEHDDWSDLALTYVKPDSLALRLARNHLPKQALVREIEPVQSQGIRLESGFEPYLRQLKSGARRKLSNQRQKLVSPELTVARGGEVEPTVRLMLQLAAPRFGVKSDAFTAFHVALARDLDRLDRLQLSLLSTAGKAISVMYIVRIRGRDYYLQSGFDVAAAQGISPGYLHMGYVIESACTAGVGYFDLLAGNGRHRDYKQDLATDQETLVCCHAVRPLWLRALYRLKTVRHLLAGSAGGGRESPKKQ